tara:strand:+ start:1907 stop:2146 length:240 start_codon:yes stop_codon:yes gene_type:complete
MKCPACGNPNTKVVDSVKTYTRNADKKQYIINRITQALRLSSPRELARQGGVGRRRYCKDGCQIYFITHEKMLQIMRRK